MEAIKAIAKRTRAGKYKIDLLINNDAAEVIVMVMVEEKKKEKSIEDFSDKINWKGYPFAYQKKH